MNVETRFIEVIGKTFQWLMQDEVTKVAAGLRDVLDERQNAKIQMQTFAETLDQWGLRVTAPLLMELVGRGSKTAAVEITRDISRHRFEKSGMVDAHACDRNSAIGANNAQIAEALLPSIQSMIERAVETGLSHVRSTAGPAGAQAQDILSGINHLAGEIHWLKSTIDTERQLRRQLEQNGPLPERSASDPSRMRRAFIAELSDTLTKSRYGEAGRDGDGLDPLDM